MIKNIFKATVGFFLLNSFVAHAEKSKEIGFVNTAWNLVKDHKVVIERFDDPKVEGVSCYISRARTGGVSGAVGVAEDPARMSIACRATGVVHVGNIEKSEKGEPVFTEKASLIFKTVNVTRFFDEEKDVLVYLAWSTKLIDGSPMNSVSAVPIHP